MAQELVEEQCRFEFLDQVSRGRFADDLGQTRDAIRYLDHYLDMEAEPDRAAIFRLGVAYLRSGQDELGFVTLRRVVSVRRSRRAKPSHAMPSRSTAAPASCA